MICFAWISAARVVSTEVPREQYPCSSGGDTVTMATSTGIIFRWNTRGISPRKIGTKSPRPSAIALRQLAPVKNEHDLYLNIADKIITLSSNKIGSTSTSKNCSWQQMHLIFMCNTFEVDISVALSTNHQFRNYKQTKFDIIRGL